MTSEENHFEILKDLPTPSISRFQRKLRCGYYKAERIFNEFCNEGEIESDSLIPNNDKYIFYRWHWQPKTTKEAVIHDIKNRISFYKKALYEPEHEFLKHGEVKDIIKENYESIRLLEDSL